MSDRLEWTEIKRRYPDEWVVLADYATAGEDFAEGVVVAHGRMRKELIPACQNLNPFAIVYTGEVTEGLVGVHVDDLDE